MSAKGYITGNDAADRILRDELLCSEKALRRVIVNERYRTLMAVRQRLLVLPDMPCRRVAAEVLEEMELALDGAA